MRTGSPAPKGSSVGSEAERVAGEAKGDRHGEHLPTSDWPRPRQAQQRAREHAKLHMPIQESSFRFVRETESVATAAQINPLCLRKLIFAMGEAAAPNGGSRLR